ncbi:hypothetical protein EHM76_04470 [bacterium]|nr:MAG: hypothetical protein EHM76_04470 [bacterium]
MWISEEEASIRIGSHSNILNRIDRDSKPHGDDSPSPIEPQAPSHPIELDPEVMHHVERALRAAKPRQRHLTEREAADAVIVGQLTSHKNAGNLFGVNDDHVRLMTDHGTQSHSSIDRPNNNLVSIIEGQRTKIRDLAFKRLNTVLECLDEDKIKGIAKARELATVGAQLAVISEKMLPKEMSADQTVHFHMYRPEVKKESDYETVAVGEERVPQKYLEGAVSEAEVTAVEPQERTGT